jgi:hypothetical protein
VPRTSAGVVVGQLGDLGDALVAQVAVLLLGEVQQGQHRRAGLGVERDDLDGALADVAAKVAHRSTSPMTGSTVEMQVMASETDPPRISSGTAWRFTKLGARTCRR